MFTLETVHDVIRIPPHVLSVPTVQAIHREIDTKYPNRILMDTGLVISRYGDCLHVNHGVCIAGEGGSHHPCSFRLIVFRPFCDEVVLGKVLKSTADGVQVTLGFFSDIFIPAYWMLNPSRYEEKSGLWVWTPQYDDAAEDAEDDEGNDHTDESRYEMNLGAEIRFKVKSINFTQITNTAKGMQATMTTMSHMPMMGRSTSNTSTTASSTTTPGEENLLSRPVRKRSSSVGIDESEGLPASMHIVGSICEDGLGLTSWWKNEDGEQEEEGDE